MKIYFLCEYFNLEMELIGIKRKINNKTVIERKEIMNDLNSKIYK